MEDDRGRMNKSDSPIEQVRLSVPISDDVSLPTLTFRVWVLGIPSCICLAFTNQFFFFRHTPVFIPTTTFQLLTLPAGRLMARLLPTTLVRIPGTNWTFSLNPGPFNIKEHVLLSTIASAGGGVPYGVEIITQMKVFYHRDITPLGALLMLLATGMLGYGFAGMFRKLLVDSPYMWWPSTLVDLSFYRALHDIEVRPKGELSKRQFFLTVSILSFAYSIVPNYFFPSITALSFVCWIWKNSITAQQIGSGRHGLGLGSLSIDWPSITYAGDPIATPPSTMANLFAGFVLAIYIVTPAAYWTNLYGGKRFPIFSADLFDSKGNAYNVSRILDKNLEFNQQTYEDYSHPYFSTFYALNYGFYFAAVSATLTHTVLFHGRSVWNQIKKVSGGQSSTTDIHNRMMRNYDTIPRFWFLLVLVPTIVVAVIVCVKFGEQFQLPLWGIALGCAITTIFIIPLGVLHAICNWGVSISIVSDIVLGYLYPGRPIASLVLKAYSLYSLNYALGFLYELKLAHYMKIPPRSMFIAQVLGPLVSIIVSFSTAWWILSAVDNVCNPDKLPKGSPWTCVGQNVAFSLSATWGVLGPARVFAPHGFYGMMYLFFLLVILMTMLIWWLSLMFPDHKWIRHINMPVILGATVMMPSLTPSNYWSFLIVGFFNYVVYRKYNRWWAKYAYTLSVGLTTGVAIMALLTSFALPGVYGVDWWGLELDDHCPLAVCPAAAGIVVQGCSAFH